MADVAESLDIALGLIRGDLDRISTAVTEGDRKMDVGERIAVVSYAGALVDAQKAGAAALAAAEREAAKLTPAELLKKLEDLPIVREMRARAERPELPAVGNGHHEPDENGDMMQPRKGNRRR